MFSWCDEKGYKSFVVGFQLKICVLNRLVGYAEVIIWLVVALLGSILYTLIVGETISR